MAKQDEFLYDSMNEGIVIAAALADAAVRKQLVHRLSSDEFLVAKHAVIWRALRVATDKGLDISDPTAMSHLIHQEGGDAEAARYAQSLDPSIPKNLEWYVDTLAWDATRARVVSDLVPKMVQALRDPKAHTDDVVGAARAVARSLEGGVGRRHVHRPTELARSYRAELAARRAHRNVYPLGFEEFDRHLTEGFMPARTTVTAGLPGAGKSTVWSMLAIYFAKAGRRVLYFCWEMPVESVMDVMVSGLTGIELRSIVQGDLNDEELDRVEKASRWLATKIKFASNPFFDDIRRGKKPSNDRNLDVLEGYIAESGCDIVIYDLWERMLFWRKPDDVTSALYRMQDIHAEYAVHGVIIQQLLLKDVEKRTDKRPTRESIKGTGAYVEVADLIFGIHREGQFKNVPDDGVETICLKQRKGKSNWAVRWRWDGSRCYVGDPQEVSYDPGLESSFEAGDIGTIRDPGDIKTKKKQGRRER